MESFWTIRSYFPLKNKKYNDQTAFSYSKELWSMSFGRTLGMMQGNNRHDHHILYDKIE